MFVGPGISKSSRSNAIIVSSTWLPWFCGCEHCIYGLAVAFCFGSKVFVFVCLHIPYEHHGHSLITAQGEIVNMLQTIQTKTCKKRKIHRENVKYIFGVDANQDLRLAEARSDDIQDIFKGVGASFVTPSNPNLTSHFKWDDHNCRCLIDWFAVSDSLFIDAIPIAEQNLDVCDVFDLQSLTSSNHFPLEMRLNLATCIAPPQIDVSRHLQLSGKLRVPKSWRPGEQTTKQLVDHIVPELDNIHNIHQLNNYGVQVAATLSKQSTNKQSNRYKHSDPESVKELIAQRNATKHAPTRASLSLRIFEARKEHNNMRLEDLCSKVAAQRWDARPEMNRLLASKKVSKRPVALRTPCDVQFPEDDQSQPMMQEEFVQYSKATDKHPEEDWPSIAQEFWGSVVGENLHSIEFHQKYLDNLYKQVVAIKMNQIQDNAEVQLFSDDLVKEGINLLGLHKANDDTGANAELLKALGQSSNIVSKITQLFNDRALAPPQDLITSSQAFNEHATFRSKATAATACDAVGWTRDGLSCLSHTFKGKGGFNGASKASQGFNIEQVSFNSASSNAEQYLFKSGAADSGDHVAVKGGKDKHIDMRDAHVKCSHRRGRDGDYNFCPGKPPLWFERVATGKREDGSVECQSIVRAQADHSMTSENKQIGNKQYETDSWHKQLCILIDKGPTTSSIEGLRPITILSIFLKLFLGILYRLIAPRMPFKGWYQHGGRKGFQCLEVVQALRILIEKSLEWALPLIILTIDIWKAFDSLHLSAVIAILDLYKVPILLRYAFLKEILASKELNMYYSGTGLGKVLANRGFRQGSPEASFLFALIICHLLDVLDKRWKRDDIGIRLRGWGGSSTAFSDWWSEHQFIFRGIQSHDHVQDLYLTSLGFLDDIYFVCSCFEQAQKMLNDVTLLFAQVGLRLNLGKIKWMRNKHCKGAENATLRVGQVLIPSVDSLVVLGSVICINGQENEAVRHRISRAWGVFHKWEHVLTSKAALSTRLSFWNKVVAPSLQWGIQTLRSPGLKSKSALVACQNLMIRKMMKIKRQSFGGHFEPWLDWHIRSLSSARDLAIKTNIEVLTSLQDKRSRWAGHVIRLGSKTAEPHICKLLVCWRPLKWWREQQVFNLIGFETIFHPFGWGQPRRWEGSLPEDWMKESFNQ